MSYDFQTTTYGKWILAGEHAVLRGHGALVFPIPEKTLTLSFKYSNSQLSADYEGSSGSDMHLLFWSVLEQGLQFLGKSLHGLTGYFHLQSNIPIGVGMGASAALCVAVARWLAWQELLADESVYSFAKNLENLFHGQSSGLDIAGVAADSGVYFQQGTTAAVKQRWNPCWFLSSCEQIGITSHCISQVQKLWQTDAIHAASIDKQMHASVLTAQQALENDEASSLPRLAEAIEQAAACFSQWGLVSENLQHHMKFLLNAGALAVKPTGSGGGGYVISLWDSPPSSIPVDFICV
ncbi:MULTISPECIES: mevalonate kinase [unclassified Legionella]|uniref:mevalonate kinase family protein n=1 Tax=unclassified Legionella TaxID=2622702 RepID=UPI001055B1C6|nr:MULTISPECIES: mevalonate kinase [unclassified Legionella]MDI9818701.1 mevalonate kinase [Legionella sp. PL877]